MQMVKPKKVGHFESLKQVRRKIHEKELMTHPQCVDIKYSKNIRFLPQSQ